MYESVTSSMSFNKIQNLNLNLLMLFIRKITHFNNHASAELRIAVVFSIVFSQPGKKKTKNIFSTFVMKIKQMKTIKRTLAVRQ